MAGTLTLTDNQLELGHPGEASTPLNPNMNGCGCWNWRAKRTKLLE